MGIAQQFYDAGHKYGFENMAVTPAQIDETQRLLGTPVSQTTSWGTTTPAIGQPLSMSLVFSGGFTANVLFTVTSSTSIHFASINYVRTATNELVFSAAGDISINTSNLGQVLQDSYLFSGNDTLNGNSYNNGFKGYAGNDRIDGGAGIDTAYFSGFQSSYKISKSGTAMTVSGPDGTDTLLNIERLKFDDKAFAFDIDSNAGQAYRLYQAAFDRKPDQAGLGHWIAHMDQGMSLSQVSSMFQQSTEFVTRYGASPSNDAFVNLLYQNVLHRAPDAGGYAYWMNILNTGERSRADVLIGFSESTENQAALIGVIQNGIEFVPQVV
jgi:hypothetical protein